MGQNDPDERLVYLACQHIFRGSHSHVRKPKAIRSLIQENRPSLADILREHNIDRTIKVVKRLLEDQVFDDTLKAKIRFPELFDVSSTQSAEREASEAEAARGEASAIREISEREVYRDIDIGSQAKPGNEGDKESESRYTQSQKLNPSSTYLLQQNHTYKESQISIKQFRRYTQYTYSIGVNILSQPRYRIYSKRVVLSSLSSIFLVFWQ